jgi:CheY-like chemotaxis protein
MASAPRILIVDDDADILANLSDILDDLGYETETAENGRVALELAGQPTDEKGCLFQLCLLDFKMPEMDGTELLQELRKRFPDIRAIMISAFSGEGEIQRAVATESLQVLRKPVDIPCLLQMIEKADA